MLLLLTNPSSSLKYPLVVVEVLSEAFGLGIGEGYDIGCKFGTTLNHSELGPWARVLDYQALVGSFHGHAYNCLHQGDGPERFGRM